MSVSIAPLERRDRIALGCVFVAALVVRLLHVLARRHDVLFDFPALDEDRYVQVARAMAASKPMEPIPWFQPPGVIYAFTLIFRLFGDGLLAPRVVQASISSGACVLVFDVARRFVSKRVALAASIVCALHGVLVFESGELLPPTWILAADVVALWALLRAREAPSPWRAIGAGSALGVSAIFSPIVLPFAVFAALWLHRVVARASAPRPSSAAIVAFFALGVALPIAPVTYGNFHRGHELVLVSTNGGINFYLGNNARYDETIALRPGRHWIELTDEPRNAGLRTKSEASTFFVKKALSFYAHEPLHAFGLYARKLFLYFDGVEIPRDTDIYAERAGSPVLRALVVRGPPAIPDGLLCPLALVGMALAMREKQAKNAPSCALLVGFVASQAIFVAAFFVTSRYRAPAIPALAIFACACVGRLYERARTASTNARAVTSAVLVALLVICNLPVREANASYAAELDFYRGLALLRNRRDAPAAIEAFRRASTVDPHDARIWFELGNADEAAHRLDDAIDAWRHAAENDRADPRAARRATTALAARGDLDAAIATLQADVDAHGRDDASYAPDHLNLAMLRVRKGDASRAVDDLALAAREDPGYFRANIAGWTRAALDAPVADASFWLALGDAVHDVDPSLAVAAWRRARASGPTAQQSVALSQRLGE